MNCHCKLIVPITCISIKADQLFWIVCLNVYFYRFRSRSLDLSVSIVPLRNGTINECTELNRAKKMSRNYQLNKNEYHVILTECWHLKQKHNVVGFFLSKSSDINIVLSVLESLIHSSSTFCWCDARFFLMLNLFFWDPKNVHLSPTRQFHIFNEFFSLPGHRLHQIIVLFGWRKNGQ